jgi:1,4-alpha-glucan branching enzyme
VEQEGEQRFVNYVFGDLLRRRWLGSGSVPEVRALVDDLASADERVRQAHAETLDRAGSAFALLLTSVGIPMFLAGEEFGDVHDLDHSDWRLKMSDPVDWTRQHQPGHQTLRERVRDLVRLRTTAPALQRNEVTFFYFHPSFDENDGVRVFAYCRTGGRPLGSPGQVVVLANCGPNDFPAFEFPWPWASTCEERGLPPSGSRPEIRPDRGQLTLSLAPFQVRVFAL